MCKFEPSQKEENKANSGDSLILQQNLEFHKFYAMVIRGGV